MRCLTLLILCCLQVFCAKSQSFAINTDGSTAHASSILDVTSTNRGLLTPRMTKIQKNAIINPATGLLVYQTGPDSTGFYFYNGSRWQWLEQAGKSWGLNGNAGTSPFSNILGTTDATDLAIGCNNVPRLFVTNEAEVSIGAPDPLYALDITTGAGAVNNCAFNGIRVNRLGAAVPNPCNTGLLMGYSSTPFPPDDDEAVIRNYGLTASGIKTLTLGVGPFLNMMKLTSDGLAGIGSGNMVPRYSLDINNSIGAVSPCGRNGIRLNTLQALGNPCDNGLFMGYNSTSNLNAVSYWNFSSLNNSTNSYIRFGFGADFSETPIGESMRILPPGQGIGINQINPQAMVHITNYTAGGVLPGVMVTSPDVNPSGTSVRGFYTGLGVIPGVSNVNNGYVWNFQNAPIIIGTNDLERMRITEGGNVGIGTNSPNAPLQIGNTNLLNRKIVLWELANNDNQYAGFSANNVIVRYQAPSTTASHVFYAGNNASSSFELVRIAGNGNIGISNPTPQNPLSFSVDLGKKISLYPGATGDAGFGVFPNELRIHSDYNNADITFGYDDYTNGFTERVRMKANGNVGIGTNPNMPLSFASVTGNKIALWGNNINNHYGFGIQGFLFQMYCGGSGDNIAFGYGSSTNFTELMRITGTGNVGIGTNTPNAPLQFSNSIVNRKIVLYDLNNNDHQYYGFGINGGMLRYQVDATGADHAFFAGVNSTSSVELMRIRGNGNVGIGTATPTQRLHVIGNILASGTITPSDSRYKKNIQPIPSPLSKLLQLNGVTYYMNRSAFPEWNFDSTLQYGVIAQEVEQLFPEMVTTINEKGFKGVNYMQLIPVLIESIKEINHKAETAEKENKELKEQVLLLLKRVEALEKKQ